MENIINNNSVVVVEFEGMKITIANAFLQRKIKRLVLKAAGRTPTGRARRTRNTWTDEEVVDLKNVVANCRASGFTWVKTINQLEEVIPNHNSNSIRLKLWALGIIKGGNLKSLDKIEVEQKEVQKIEIK